MLKLKTLWTFCTRSREGQIQLPDDEKVPISPQIELQANVLREADKFRNAGNSEMMMYYLMESCRLKDPEGMFQLAAHYKSKSDMIRYDEYLNKAVDLKHLEATRHMLQFHLDQRNVIESTKYAMMLWDDHEQPIEPYFHQIFKIYENQVLNLTKPTFFIPEYLAIFDLMTHLNLLSDYDYGCRTLLILMRMYTMHNNCSVDYFWGQKLDRPTMRRINHDVAGFILNKIELCVNPLYTKSAGRNDFTIIRKMLEFSLNVLHSEPHTRRCYRILGTAKMANGDTKN
jgi:hypothetical protein